MTDGVLYYWIRIFDYRYDDELSHIAAGEWTNYKGVLLDEYYLSGEGLSREACKEEVKKRSGIERFAKSKKKQEDCLYSIVMDSDKWFFDRFYDVIDTVCFGCGCDITGKAHQFRELRKDRNPSELSERLFFCSRGCEYQTNKKLNPPDCEWQEKEDYETNGGVYGYIYYIYNRRTNKHYIGQSVYMPFFRWQDHVKNGLKGDICDLSFEVITEVRVKNQGYLNDVEAWWIRKYIKDYGRDNVMNMNVPVVKISELLDLYNRAIEGKKKMRNENGC